jgi:hypothetical protein
LLGAPFLLATCSAETDDNNFCSLSCGDAIIGSSDFKIKATVGEWKLACLSSSSSITELDPFAVQFDVYKEVTGSDDEIKKIPVPNVKITPLVNGVMGTNQTNDELKNDSRFKGIKTGPSEWCTDSCGVFTLEVIPACVPGVENEISITARSGFASSEEPLKIIVTDETNNTEQ